MRASENSINFIIVGENILQVEQTERHWRMMGLKGRNEICEHSFRILIFLYWWFYAKSRIWSNFAFCSACNLHQTSWFFLLANVQAVFLCLQPESQPLLGATVQPRAQQHTGQQTLNTCGSCSSALSTARVQPAAPPVLLTHGGDAHVRETGLGRSLPFGFGELFSHQFL